MCENRFVRVMTHGSQVFIGDTECEVIQLHSTPNQIVCKTMAPAIYRDLRYRVRVVVDGNRQARCAEEVASVHCDFYFRDRTSCTSLLVSLFSLADVPIAVLCGSVSGSRRLRACRCTAGRTSDLRSVSPMVLHEPTVVRLNGYHRFSHLNQLDHFTLPTREVVQVTVKILNKGDQVGLPGDSAIGGNGDFCKLYNETIWPHGYVSNKNDGYLKCLMDTTEREAGFYNFTIVQADDYGESRVKDSAFLYQVDGRPFTVAVAPKVESISPQLGSAAGGTVSGVRFT